MAELFRKPLDFNKLLICTALGQSAPTAYLLFAPHTRPHAAFASHLKRYPTVILRHWLLGLELRGNMEPTDTSKPDYFHRVVDCQWACPAHTDVPEYIRLIAQGEFTQAYMVNRESNVFPGILGRFCDRPCDRR